MPGREMRKAQPRGQDGRLPGLTGREPKRKGGRIGGEPEAGWGFRDCCGEGETLGGCLCARPMKGPWRSQGEGSRAEFTMV